MNLGPIMFSKLLPLMVVMIVAFAASTALPTPESDTSNRDALRDTGIRTLGAARGYATTALWLRAGDAYRRGDYFETLADYQMIQQLQPRNPSVYSYLQWNQAYNISAQFPDRERQTEWVIRGLKTLHEGQDALPKNAALRMDEWHFLLNRTRYYPTTVLRGELTYHAKSHPIWATTTRRAIHAFDAIPESDKEVLLYFLREVGFQALLFDSVRRAKLLDQDSINRMLNPAFEDLSPEDQGNLGQQFDEYERYQLREFGRLSPACQDFLELADWCRWHLMVMILLPVIDFPTHGLSVNLALLTSCRNAWFALPSNLFKEFNEQYRQGVAKGFHNGVEAAVRIYGDVGGQEFVDNMRASFEDMPDWLPAKTE